MKPLFNWSVLLCLFLFLACNKKSDDLPLVDKSANLLTTGLSANDILSNDKFKNLKIEIAYVAGFRPSELAMTLLINYIKRHTFKENIEMVFNELPAPTNETLTTQEVADLEAKNRTVYNDGETLGIYIYFVDVPFDGDNESQGTATLGSVYRNTSMVIYESTVRRIADRNIIPDAIVETATINHEFGHLLGLVNLGTTAVNDHEDAESNNHCSIDGCLMRAELRFTPVGKSSGILTNNDELTASCSLSEKSVIRLLKNASAKGFVNSVPLDAECMLDLNSNGGR